VCCPIHGRIALSEIDLEASLNCLVHDGTFYANASVSEPQLCFELLGYSDKLDQVRGSAAAAGTMDQTSHLFSKCSGNFRFQQYRVKAIVTEAIQKVTNPAHFVGRKVRIGRSIYHAYSYPGRISLNVAQAFPMDAKETARRYLDLLEL
jgi:hypothetical protein